MAWKPEVKKITWFASFNALPEPVKYEVGDFVRAVLLNPYHSKITDPRLTVQYDGSGKQTTRLHSGYRVMWNVAADGVSVLFWDILPPVTKQA
jgi:hypothetical protein